MRSLKRTLGFGLIASLIAIVLLQWWLVSITFREIIENNTVTRLQHEVDELLGSLTSKHDGTAELEGHVVGEYDGHPFSGQYYQLQIDDQVLRSRTLWDQDLAIEPVQAGERLQMRMAGPLDQQLMVLAQGFRKQGRHVTVAVAEDISAINQQITEFQYNYFLLSAVLLGLLFVLQLWLVRRSLQPLKGVQKDLQKLERGEVHRVRENVPAEIRPLVREVNRLLVLLNQRVERSRHMVGNLAHALKTPLSVLTQTLESGQLDDKPALRRQMTEQTRTIHQQLEQELSRARLAGDSSSGRRFQPADDLPGLIKVLQQAYPEKQIELSGADEAAAWPAERQDMLELFGNLIDNACKWAKSGVSIQVRDDENHVLIVEDDGPGLSPANREQLGRRGQRFDEQAEGHGLGLAIAREIVDHYQGRLDFSDSPIGGLRVRFELPGDV